MKSLIIFVVCVTAGTALPEADPALVYNHPFPLYYNYPAQPVLPYGYAPYHYAPLEYRKTSPPVASVKKADTNVETKVENVEEEEGMKAPAHPLARAYSPLVYYNHYPYYYNNPYNFVANQRSVLQTLN